MQNPNPFQGRPQSYPVANTAMVQEVMQQVYLWMCLALILTAVTAVTMAATGLTESLAMNPIVYFGLFIVELGLVWWLSSRIFQMEVGQAFTLFFVYAALNGVTLSVLLLVYTQGSIAGAFVSSGAMFGAMSLLGATTKMDLSKLGSILLMALIGLIVAMLVNFLLASPMLNFVISVAGVIIFSGLTAYDTQRIQRMASTLPANSDAVMRVSIMGALILYLDFINLFIYLLRLMGNRR
jgi:hypothetical protein